jgi:hypothetical protein
MMMIDKPIFVTSMTIGHEKPSAACAVPRWDPRYRVRPVPEDVQDSCKSFLRDRHWNAREVVLSKLSMPRTKATARHDKGATGQNFCKHDWFHDQRSLRRFAQSVLWSSLQPTSLDCLLIKASRRHGVKYNTLEIRPIPSFERTFHYPSTLLPLHFIFADPNPQFSTFLVASVSPLHGALLV